MEEFAGDADGVELTDWFVAVDSLVAETVDEAGFGEDGVSGGGFEGGLVKERAEVLLIRELEGGIVFVKPVEGQFEGASGVKDGGAGVGMGERFGFGGGIKDVRPFGAKELEVGIVRGQLPIRFSCLAADYGKM